MTLQGHWYMLSLAVGWTIVTACWLVLVVNCYRSYKLSRMLPLVLLQELENVSIWLLFYAAFIGYQFDSGSLSRQQFWHTSVNMVRLRNTCSRTVTESTSTCTGRRHLRSAQMRLLVVPRTRTKHGDCSFAIQGPRVWNSLPAELQAPRISLTVFRNKLKTYLFDT